MTPEPEESQETENTRERVWIDWLLIALVAILAYLPAVDAPFVFDDLMIVLDNEFVQQGDTASILTTGYWDGHDPELGKRQALYRPLTVLSFAWNWALAGNSPAGFRWVNLLLHALTSVLVLLLSRRLLDSRVGALCGALVFAAHPIHTEAVTYVSGRADLLAALFFFGAWLTHELRGRKRGHTLLFVVSLALYAAGLLAKEMAATLPAVLILFDYVADRKQGAGLREALRGLRRRASTYAAYFAILLLFLFARSAVLGGLLPRAGDIPVQANPLRDLALVERLDDASALVGRQLALLAVPHPLSIDYSFDAIPVSPERLSDEALPWAALALAALLLGLGGMLLRRGLHASAALLFFLGTLFPVSNLAFVIGTNLGERVLYLCSFALSLVLGAAGAWAARRGRGPAIAALVVALALTAAAGWRTVLRNRDYVSGYRLFQAAAEAYPRASRAHYNFGVYAYERSVELAHGGDLPGSQGELSIATAAYERALEIDPGYAEAHYELGRIAHERGDVDAAMPHFEAVLSAGSQADALPDAVTAFADCCLARGEALRGRDLLERKIAGRVPLQRAYGLAQGLFEVELENDPAAREHFESVLAGPEPEDEAHIRQRLRARVELARVYARAGEHAAAEELFELALATETELIGPHLVWIRFLRERGRFEEALLAIGTAELIHVGHYALAAERAEVARVQEDWNVALQQHLAVLGEQPRHGPSRRGLASLGADLVARVRGERLSEADAFEALRIAETALRSALELGVRRPGLQHDYFGVLMAVGRWDEAAQGFEAIAERGGQRAAEASLRAGECRLARNEFELARAAFARAKQLDAKSEAAHLGLLRLDLRDNPLRVSQELALVPSQAATPESALVRLLALEALADDTRLVPALFDFESRHGVDPEALLVDARRLARAEPPDSEALQQAQRAVALARPGAVVYVRCNKVLAELLELDGRTTQAEVVREALSTWAPEDPGL